MEQYIKIESFGNEQTKVEIHGNGGKLAEMLANAIVNDMNLGMLVVTAMAKIAEENTNPIKDINLN